MELISNIQDIVTRIPKQRDHIRNQQATKTAFVLPFFNALGYDIFNPLEVIPDFTVNRSEQPREKMDYALSKDEKIIALVECRWCGDDLEHDSPRQLHQLYSLVPDVRLGILTNGISYQFFTDIDDNNQMDWSPFFEFNLLNFGEKHFDQLKMFQKDSFDVNLVLSHAGKLKYESTVKKSLAHRTVDVEEKSDHNVVSPDFHTSSDSIETQEIRDEFIPDVPESLINKKIKYYISLNLDDPRYIKLWLEYLKVKDYME